MKLLFPADHLKSISVPKAFETMYLPHGEILPGECFSCVCDMLMRISIQISSHCAIPMGKNSSAVLDFFLHHQDECILLKKTELTSILYDG